MKKYTKFSVFVFFVLILICGCGPSEVIKSKSIFLSDYPAWRNTYIPLKNYQSTEPNACGFVTKYNEEEVLDTIKNFFGDNLTVTEYISTHNIKGYLLEIADEDNIYFQNLYLTNNKLGINSDKYHGYELNCGNLYLYSDSNPEIEYGELLFPLVILDSNYSHVYTYSCCEEILTINKKYPLRKSALGEINYLNVLYDYYSKLIYYEANLLNDNQLQVRAIKDIIKEFDDTGDDALVWYAPSASYYTEPFIINIKDDYLYITLPKE